MKEIFISYSSIDITSAETVRNVLEKNGLSCWMAPRDIPGGSNYTKEIPIAIHNCKIFVLILSKNAQGSHWVLKELDTAVNSGKVILPFMLEDCTLNDEFNFLLTGAQRYAAYQKKAEAMETLVNRIRGLLGVADEAPAAPVSATEPIRPESAVKKPAASLHPGNITCPACGSTDLKLLPKRIKRHGPQELLTMLWIPVLGIVCCFVLLFLCSAFLPGQLFNIGASLSFLGIFGGGLWGNYISINTVKRSRLRKRVQSTCYRCSRCGKVFLRNAPIDN